MSSGMLSKEEEKEVRGSKGERDDGGVEEGEGKRKREREKAYKYKV